MTEYYQKNKARIIAYQKAYRQRVKNEDKELYERQRQKRIEYRKTDKGRFESARRSGKYKLSFQEFSNAKKKQKTCAICKQERRLVVDHCHKTLEFRGLLCISCNTGLGHFKDSLESLKNAVQYLKKQKTPPTV